MEDLRVALGTYVQLQNLLQHVLHVDLQNVNKIQPKFRQGLQVIFAKLATLIITNYGTHNKLKAINSVLVFKVTNSSRSSADFGFEMNHTKRQI